MKTGVGFSPEGQFKLMLSDKTHNGLKCYEVIDGEITGMSIVSNPANQTKAVITSEKDRIITGAILIPDVMIYRINPITGEQFYIFFTPEVIKILHEKYRLINWTQTERNKLIQMFAEGFAPSEIASELNRTEVNVTNRIKEEGKAFRDWVLVIMAQNNKSLKEMSERLNIEENKLFKIIKSLGGKIVRKDNAP